MKINSPISTQRTIPRIAAVFILLLIPGFTFPGAQEDKADKMDSVLRHMEESSGNFQSFTADITKKTYTAILEEFDPPESGKFYYKRAGDGSALIREEITDPAEKITTLNGGEALIYQPKVKSAISYELGKHRDKAEYMALGIGQSPTDLKKTFNIAYQGNETVNGAACSILELKPKDPKVASIFSSITVWIDEATGVSKQMKMEEPFEDYILVIFSNEKLNKKINDSMFEQELPQDVDIQRIN
ncbi:MAG: outer membrane lipoprotein carrier protein LolA [Acidobacteria bacterium]|nr:outer membrane lipoprotein carrier protein LolA [Acidobacteriota bacterium]